MDYISETPYSEGQLKVPAKDPAIIPGGSHLLLYLATSVCLMEKGGKWPPNMLSVKKKKKKLS